MGETIFGDDGSEGGRDDDVEEGMVVRAACDVCAVMLCSERDRRARGGSDLADAAADHAEH